MCSNAASTKSVLMLINRFLMLRKKKVINALSEVWVTVSRQNGLNAL